MEDKIEYKLNPNITEKSVREMAQVIGPYAKPTGMLRLHRIESRIQTEPLHGYDQPGCIEIFQWEQLWRSGFGEVWLPVPISFD